MPAEEPPTQSTSKRPAGASSSAPAVKKPARKVPALPVNLSQTSGAAKRRRSKEREAAPELSLSKLIMCALPQLARAGERQVAKSRSVLRSKVCSL